MEIKTFKSIPGPIKKLWKEAVRAQTKAYAPYSHFKVGAAFENKKKIYTGCNIENASYGATICAERVALVKAVSEGPTDIQNIVIVANTQDPTPPCGLCLQMLSEFASAKLVVWLANKKKIFGSILFSHLLTVPFSKKKLRK